MMIVRYFGNCSGIRHLQLSFALIILAGCQVGQEEEGSVSATDEEQIRKQVEKIVSSTRDRLQFMTAEGKFDYVVSLSSSFVLSGANNRDFQNEVGEALCEEAIHFSTFIKGSNPKLPNEERANKFVNSVLALLKDNDTDRGFPRSSEILECNFEETVATVKFSEPRDMTFKFRKVEGNWLFDGHEPDADTNDQDKTKAGHPFWFVDSVSTFRSSNV